MKLKPMGLIWYTGQAVERIEKANGALKVFGADLDLESGMVLVAIGVAPNSAIAQRAGIELSVEPIDCRG